MLPLQRSSSSSTNDLLPITDLESKPNIKPATVNKPNYSPMISIGDILQNELEHYSLKALIEDSNHIDVFHCYDNALEKKKYLAIFEYFEQKLGPCLDCNILSRANRNRSNDKDLSKRRQMYYGFTHNKDIAIITTLDTQHSFWFHSTDLYKRNERHYSKADFFERKVNDSKYNDSATDNDIDDDDDEDNKVNYEGNKSLKLNKITEENSSSVLPENASKFVSSVQNFKTQTDEKKENESNNDNQNDHENDEEHILVNFEFGEHFEYYTEAKEKFNNYIAAKYRDLRQELLQNKVKPMDRMIYDDVITKVRILYDTEVIKQMKAMRCYYTEIANIPVRSKISKEHLISIMVYTNHSEIQRSFKETMRLPTKIKNYSVNEQLVEEYGIYLKGYQALKEKNAEIANWCRLLFESVRFWGTIMTEEDYFYHGIDRTLLFDKVYAAFKCPISTTTHIGVAESFKDSEGIIMRVGCTSEKSMVPFLDVSFISDYRSESERLFYGADLLIVDIYHRKVRYDYILRALSLFQHIVSGGFFTHNTKLLNRRNQRRLMNLIEYYLKYHNEGKRVISKDKSKKDTQETHSKFSNTNNNANDKMGEDTYANAKSQSGPTQKPKKEKEKESNVFAQRPMKKKKSQNDLSTYTEPNNGNSSKKRLSMLQSQSNALLVPEPIAKRKKETRKYHHQLFDFFVSSRKQKRIWLCKKELNSSSMLPELRQYFICEDHKNDEIDVDDNKEEKELKMGNLLQFMMERFKITVQFSTEFEWNLGEDFVNKLLSKPSNDSPHSNDSDESKQLKPIAEQTFSSHIIHENEPYDIEFVAECFRTGECVDFFWNLTKLPQEVTDIQVTIDVKSQMIVKAQRTKPVTNQKSKVAKNRVISHDIYEGEWMTLDEKEGESYFGGKAMDIVKDFYGNNQWKNKANMKRKFDGIAWKIALRVTRVIEEEEKKEY